MAQQSYHYLTSQGLTPEAAAGIMGNMQQENSMSTADNSGGMGLIQWTGSRRTAEINYAKQHGLSPTSTQAQLGYLMKELSDGNQGVTIQQLNAAGSPEAAALLFSQRFERPGVPMNNKRQSYANQFFNLYGK